MWTWFQCVDILNGEFSTRIHDIYSVYCVYNHGAITCTRGTEYSLLVNIYFTFFLVNIYFKCEFFFEVWVSLSRSPLVGRTARLQQGGLLVRNTTDVNAATHYEKRNVKCPHTVSCYSMSTHCILGPAANGGRDDAEHKSMCARP